MYLVSQNFNVANTPIRENSASNLNADNIDSRQSQKIYNEIKHAVGDKTCLMVVGFSAQKYSNLTDVREKFANIIDEIAKKTGSKDDMAVISGATDCSITQIANDPTLTGINHNIGIVSEQARDCKGVEINLNVGTTIYVPSKDGSWETKDAAGNQILAEIKEQCGIEKDCYFIAIGGGEIAREETIAAIKAGLNVTIVFAETDNPKLDKNHQPLPSVNDLIKDSIIKRKNVKHYPIG